MRNKKVKISIIIPCYNTEKYINNMFSTLRNQSFDDYEVIFVDDGSTDNTNKIIQNYLKENHRAKLITLPVNMGAGNARNIGIQNCKGEYVMFLDSDDMSSEDFLQIAYKTAKKENVDITLFKTNYYNYEKNRLYNDDVFWLWHYKKCPIETVFTKEDVKDRLFSFCRGVLWNKLFKRKLITDNNLVFLNTPKHNDTYFVYTAYACANTFYVIDKILYTYCVHRPDSITYDGGSRICQKANYMALYQFLQTRGLLEEYGAALDSELGFVFKHAQ